MRRIFLVIFFLFSFLFLVKRGAFAACSEFKVDPKSTPATVDFSCDTDINPYNNIYKVEIRNTSDNNLVWESDKIPLNNGSARTTFYLPAGSYMATLYIWNNPTQIEEDPFTIEATTVVSPLDIHGKCSQVEINTALGCIPADSLNNFVKWFLSKLIFVASGIAFLLMAFGAFKILTSAGSPEGMQAGKELITSALAGLIFIILSLFLLKLIGVDILQIPGFSR